MNHLTHTFPVILISRNAFTFFNCCSFRLCVCVRIVRVCVCVSEAGPGRGHTVWPTAMRNRLVPAPPMRRTPQNSSVTKPFSREPRGERMSRCNSIPPPCLELKKKEQIQIYTNVLKQTVQPSFPHTLGKLAADSTQRPGHAPPPWALSSERCCCE